MLITLRGLGLIHPKTNIISKSEGSVTIVN